MLEVRPCDCPEYTLWYLTDGISVCRCGHPKDYHQWRADRRRCCLGDVELYHSARGQAMRRFSEQLTGGSTVEKKKRWVHVDDLTDCVTGPAGKGISFMYCRHQTAPPMRRWIIERPKRQVLIDRISELNQTIDKLKLELHEVRKERDAINSRCGSAIGAINEARKVLDGAGSAVLSAKNVLNGWDRTWRRG